MTDSVLVTLINSQTSLQNLANVGSDASIVLSIPSLATITIPVPFTAQQIIGAISISDIGKVVNSPMYSSIQTAIQTQDATTLGFQAQLCLAAGLITQAEVTAIQAILSATQNIPDTSVTRQQVSRVLNVNRTQSADGGIRALPLTYPLPVPSGS